ncbi:hypothetical protein [Streptomyces sp. BpilaLS-43]|nr:hypothetical protein [Streptomyces sp. BpilaLS-43]
MSAFTTGAPASTAPKSMTSTSRRMKPRTVPYRATSSARHSASSSPSASGTAAAIVASASASCSRGTTCSIADHASTTETSSPVSVAGGVVISTSTAAATFFAAFRSWGRALSLASLPIRSAFASSLVAISACSRSSASSTVAVSRCRTVASSVAVCLVTSSRFSVGAFEVSPYRASPVIRAAGTRPASTAPAPRPRTSRARSRASSMALPDTRIGPSRSRSSSDTRFFSGTSSSRIISVRRSYGTASYSAACSRSFSSDRTAATIRASVVTPGNSTRLFTSHTTARSNRARGPSNDDHTRAARNSFSSASPAAKSR